MTKQEILAIAKPILFNTEMVMAILDGRKTVTRRVVKPRYRDDEGGFQVITTRSGEFVRVEKVDENECGIFADGTERYVNPPYSPGDVLWVRETWNRYKKRVGKGAACHTEELFGYRAAPACAETYSEKWRPSIHMPKEAARLFLQVTDVRAERLQDITEEQAKAEGCIGIDPYTYQNPSYYDNVNADNYWKATFAGLWDSLLPKNKNKFKCPEYTWRTNPWVWVIEFERIEVEE